MVVRLVNSTTLPSSFDAQTAHVVDTDDIFLLYTLDTLYRRQRVLVTHALSRRTGVSDAREPRIRVSTFSFAL